MKIGLPNMIYGPSIFGNIVVFGLFCVGYCSMVTYVSYGTSPLRAAIVLRKLSGEFDVFGPRFELYTSIWAEFGPLLRTIYAASAGGWALEMIFRGYLETSFQGLDCIFVCGALRLLAFYLFQSILWFRSQIKD